VNETVPDLILAVIAAAGIPSTIFGIAAHKYAKRQGDREESWVQGMTSVLETSYANYKQGRECAKAIQRMDPDGKFHNGDFATAMEYAQDANHRQQDYVRGEAAKRHG
jgi:hypothetical protein